MKDKTTNELQSILNKTKPENIGKYLKENQDSLYSSDRAFSEFMRSTLKSKKISQQEVFAKAIIPERYGYKLISGEKKTIQRDVILRLCIVAEFSLKDTQTALTLYSMPVLYPKIPRDSVLIIAINRKFKEIGKVDDLLTEYGFEKLRSCGVEDT